MGQKRPTTTSMILGLSHCQSQALSKKAFTFTKLNLSFCDIFFQRIGMDKNS